MPADKPELTCPTCGLIARPISKRREFDLCHDPFHKSQESVGLAIERLTQAEIQVICRKMPTDLYWQDLCRAIESAVLRKIAQVAYEKGHQHGLGTDPRLVDFSADLLKAAEE